MAASQLVGEGFLVEHVLSKSWTNTFQVGDMVRQLLNGLDLFSEEIRFDPVAELKTRKKLKELRSMYTTNYGKL